MVFSNLFKKNVYRMIRNKKDLEIISNEVIGEARSLYIYQQKNGSIFYFY